ncbi:MAG: hypothetical protein AAF532_08030 [Planctomycetota bacterium]
MTRPTPHTRRGGFTLLELALASGSAAVLAAGMAGAILIAARSADRTTGGVAGTLDAHTALNELAGDLASAAEVTELTATEITFEVPRATPTDIRYAWSGVAGTPVTRSIDGGTAVDVITDVTGFAIAPETETVGAKTVLRHVSVSVTTSDGGAARVGVGFHASPGVTL